MAEIMYNDEGYIWFDGHLSPEELAANFKQVWIHPFDDYGNPVTEETDPADWNWDWAPWAECTPDTYAAKPVTMYDREAAGDNE